MGHGVVPFHENVVTHGGNLLAFFLSYSPPRKASRKKEVCLVNLTGLLLYRGYTMP